MIFLANTKKQDLMQHSKVIANLAVKIFEETIDEKQYNKLVNQYDIDDITYSYENLDSKGNWQKRITKNSENKHELVDIQQIRYYE